MNNILLAFSKGFELRKDLGLSEYLKLESKFKT